MRKARDILAQMDHEKTLDSVRSRLESYATYLVRDNEDARDIVSSAFTTLLQNPLSVKEDSIVPYLFRAVHNLCLNYRRDAARHREAHSRIREREGKAFAYYSTLLESSDPSALFMSEISNICRQQIARMPDEVQKTYALRCNGLSYKEIAQELNINENRVDKNLRKVLTALKRSLSDYL